MAIHDRAYTRAKDWSKALRKYHIDRNKSGEKRLLYNNLHQYSFNKLHCSCKSKTNNKNRKGGRGWEPSKNWSISDRRKINSMIKQENEFYEEL